MLHLVAANKRRELKRLSKAISRPSDYNGLNRRLISLLPKPQERTHHLAIPLARYIKHRELFNSIQSHRSTCCVHIESNNKKSRAAILIYRGRALACIYGRQGYERHIEGEPALNEAMADLAQIDSCMDAYYLDDDLAIAAAAIFHGEKNTIEGSTASARFLNARTSFIDTNSTGTIVLKNTDGEFVAVLYLSKGALKGVFSFKNGWLRTSYEEMRAILRDGSIIVESYQMTRKEHTQLHELAVPLSNLEQHALELEPTEQRFSQGLLKHFSHKPSLRMTFMFDRFSATDEHSKVVRRVADYALRRSWARHSHLVNPFVTYQVS